MGQRGAADKTCKRESAGKEGIGDTRSTWRWEGRKKKCKNSYGPGRLVMKIQSVMLKRELWPAAECWRRRPVPPARAWQDIAMLKIPAQLAFASALKAWRDSKRLRLLSLWPADSLVARKDGDKEEGGRKKRTSSSRINNATFWDQEEKNVRKIAKMKEEGKKLGDKSGRMSLLQLEYLGLEQQVWRMQNESSVCLCASVSAPHRISVQTAFVKHTYTSLWLQFFDSRPQFWKHHNIYGEKANQWLTLAEWGEDSSWRWLPKWHKNNTTQVTQQGCGPHAAVVLVVLEIHVTVNCRHSILLCKGTFHL